MVLFMTERIFKSYMNKLPKGEYDASDLFALYMIICPKSYADTSKFENNMRFWSFVEMFEAKKYGFVYMFGNIEYIGTNDLHTLMVR